MSYCNGCGCPHSDEQPCGRTITEQLDNATDGRQFGAALEGLFRHLEKAKDDE